MTISRTAILASCLYLAGTLAAAAQNTARDTARHFYEGKTIHWFVGGGPGGGFDQYARLIAPALQQATGATVVVEYRPAGGGMTGINQVEAADPDGLTLMLINGVPAALGQITKSPAVRFKLEGLPYLGRVAAEPWVLLVSKESGYKSMQDLIAASAGGKTLSFSGLGRTDGPTDTAAVACEALALKCKLVVGFKGSSASALAAIRGDVTGIAVTDRSALDFSSDGTLIPVAVIGRKRSKLLPDVPTIFEVATISDDRAFWIDFRASIVEIGRALITTPGTPAERIAFLRQTFEQILNDPAFDRTATERGLPIDYAAGREVQDTIKKVFNDLPTDRLQAVRNVLLTKYF